MRRLLLILPIVILTLACVPAQQTAPTSEEGQPKYGGTINRRIVVDPHDWDTSYGGKGGGSKGQHQAYDSLLRFKKGPNVPFEELTLEPELAERWTVSPDAKTFTFNLRKGVKYANLPPLNGRELTSADVKFSYEYASRLGEFKDKKLPVAQFEWMFEGLDKIETPDPYTAVVSFKDPFVPFLSFVADDYNLIHPRELYDQDGHLKDRIVGTGPYQLDPAASQKGSRWLWKKNATYWDLGKSYVDEIRWLVINENAAAIAAFQSKQLDHLNTEVFTYQGVQEFKKTNPTATLYQYSGEAGQHIYLQTAKPPFDDIRVRKAVAYGIDREELAKVHAGGPAPWAPTGAMIGLFTDEEARKMHKHDPAEARRLLTEAGHNRLDVVVNFPGKAQGDAYITNLELVQAQFKKIGIDLVLKSIDQSDFSNERKNRTYMMNFGSLSPGETGDYDQAIFATYHSKSKANYGAFADPELDKLLEGQRAAVDPAQRKQVLRQAVQRIMDQVWAVDLHYLPKWEAWQPWLKNFNVNRGQNGPHFENAWIEK